MMFVEDVKVFIIYLPPAPCLETISVFSGAPTSKFFIVNPFHAANVKSNGISSCAISNGAICL